MMAAADEFTLMKLEYSRWARCSCCKGYSTCRGLELRCQKSLNSKNANVAECRLMLFDEQTFQNEFHGSVEPKTLASKYEEFCRRDVQAALDIGRLDFLRAERLVRESWQTRSPEDDEAYLEFPHKEDDEDAISEISFDGSPLGESMFREKTHEKIGILRKTARLLLRALKPRRIR
jgi:hypothetical protein